MAPTYTTRLGLKKPAGSDKPVVTEDIGGNMDLIDSVLGFAPVTSTTRPSTPFAGQSIYETDTKLAYVHNGTSPASAGWEAQMFHHVRYAASSSTPNATQPGHAWYESDNHRLKVSNSTTAASGGWEWPSIPVVSATNQVPNPWDGMLVFNITDRLLYVYYGGAVNAWRKATAYARYTKATDQTIGGGDTLVSFATAVATDPRVVASGTGNTSFTLDPGRWKVSSSCRANNTGLTTGIFLVTGTAATEATAFATNSTSFLNIGASDTIEFTTATAVSVVIWNSGGAASQVLKAGANGGCQVSFVREL